MQEKTDNGSPEILPTKNVNHGVKTEDKSTKAETPLATTASIDFKEGMVVSVMNVFYRIKKIKPAKDEMLLRKLSPAETKKVDEYIEKRKER